MKTNMIISNDSRMVTRMAHVVRLVVLLTGHLLRNTSMVTLRI